MPITFRFSHIRLDQFAAFDVVSSQLPPVFQTSGEIQTGNNYDARTILITVIADVKVEGQLVITIKTSCFFEIAEDSWDSLKQNGFVVIPKDFLYHIGGLAVSTTRGILFAKTEGTDLSCYVLPIVYMDQVIHSDMKIPCV